MQIFIPGYHNVFLRTLYSMFVCMPIEFLWFRSLARLLPSYTWKNYTNLTDAQLLAQWQVAQQAIASGNWITAIGGPNGKSDARALTTQPSNVAVVPVTDWTVADLMKFDSNWTAKNTNPSGAFAIVDGFSYETCHACTYPWARPRVYCVLSELSTPNLLSYEFQNVILNILG